MVKIRKWIGKKWCLGQFAFIGFISGLFNDNSKMSDPPNKIGTPLGIAAIFAFVATFIFIYLSKMAICFILRKKFEEPDIDKVANKIIPKKLEQYIEKHGAIDHNEITYAEEYIYYKYYYKAAKFSFKKKWINNVPKGLEDKYLNAYKNYMVAKLVGLEEETAEYVGNRLE